MSVAAKDPTVALEIIKYETQRQGMRLRMAMKNNRIKISQQIASALYNVTDNIQSNFYLYHQNLAQHFFRPYKLVSLGFQSRNVGGKAKRYAGTCPGPI